MRKFFCLCLLLFSAVQGAAAQNNLRKTIFVWGDSHATPFCQLPNAKEVYGGSMTMYRVGREHFNLSTVPFKPGDVALFSFGQIDANWHVCKQRDLHHRDIEEIVQSLAQDYVSAVAEMTKPYLHLIKVIYNVIPPSDQSGLSIPYQGSIEDRVAITKQLNDWLRILCPMHGIEFIDIYDDLKDEQGMLRREIRDSVSFFHVDIPYYNFVYSKLFEIMEKHD